MNIKPLLYPLLNLKYIGIVPREYYIYWRNWRKYSSLTDNEVLLLKNAYPCLFDRTVYTKIDYQYFYQNVWALKAINEIKPALHVDIGSQAIFIGMLSVISPVIFIDIRPIKVGLENLRTLSASILDLPIKDNCVSSLSCLHVAEHIGLGRYGDDIDPFGTLKGIKELIRILKPGGMLYFSIPLGISRICFNAHRIFSLEQILNYFHELKLVELSWINDSGKFISDADPKEIEGAEYSLGLFRFTKIT